MTIKLFIKYNTQWGEELYVSGSSSELGSNDIDSALKLSCSSTGIWYGEFNCNPAEKDRIISYKYFIKHRNDNGGTSVVFENGLKRKLALSSDTLQIICYDEWQGTDKTSTFLTTPFSKVFFDIKSNPYTQTHNFGQELIIKATIPNIPKSCTIGICGNTAELGNWNINDSAIMSREEGCKWTLALSTDNLPKILEYKFVFNNTEWEECDNRKFELDYIPRHTSIIKEHNEVIFPDKSSLDYIKNPRYAGCAIPVFSLRTERSHGIGDFGDIKTFVDFMSKSGLRVLQLLPINDTCMQMNWHDSYPYNCISSFALHPIYINLIDVLINSEGQRSIDNIMQQNIASNTQTKGKEGNFFGGLLSGKRKKAEEQDPNDKNILDLITKIKREGKLLNTKSLLDYEEVLESKFRLLREIFNLEKENTFAQPEFYSFIKSNKHWINTYAKFCVLRDKNKTVLKEESDLYIFIQYHLYLQMSSAKKYARGKGIVLKGDIPIGVSPNSIAVWQNPELFHLDESAGAPPDAFCKEGQNWGFPTYNWDEMSKTHYSWWRYRFAQMTKYFDAYRLDHILGFFRIWEIPTKYNSALMGHFSPALTYSREEIAKLMGLQDQSACRDDWFIDNCTDGALAGTFSTASDSALIRSVSKNQIEYETLFIEDPYKHREYHPMIGAKESYAYYSLSPSMKSAYDAIYNSFFYERNNQMWYNNAFDKLQQLIASSNMLACGEDLGMRNQVVTECMKRLNILSLELQTMPKEFGVEFGNPADYPYLSVCTTSTHDSETLRMWLGRKLHGDGSDATPQECEKIVTENLSAKSMFTILPLQDWLSISEKHRSESFENERINDPSNPDNYWRYRMPVLIEDLLNDDDFCTKISRLINSGGRIV